MARAQPKEPARARAFRNRIVDHGEEDPAEIQMHPSNWRRHPEHQARSLRDVMNEVGVVDEVIINRRTGRLLNGHLRVQLAREEGHDRIPVKYVDLSEDEERVILVSFDAMSAMAAVDEEALRALAAEIPAGDEEWLSRLSDEILDAYKLLGETTDPNQEWEGMPEFVQDDKRPFRSIIVHFKDQEAVDEFARILQRPLTEKTRYLWFPEMEIERYADKRYVSEQAEPNGSAE